MKNCFKKDLEYAAQCYACGFPSEDAAFQAGAMWAFGYSKGIKPDLSEDPDNIFDEPGTAAGIINKSLKLSQRLRVIATALENHKCIEAAVGDLRAMANQLASAKVSSDKK